MTPLPVAPRHEIRVPAQQPIPPPIGRTCTAPGCTAMARHRHHAVPRSWFGITGGLDYVLIAGTRVLNLVDLCFEHHDDLESAPGGCRARLRWAGGWAWYTRAKPSETTGILFRDPKTGVWRLKGFCRGEYVHNPE